MNKANKNWEALTSALHNITKYLTEGPSSHSKSKVIILVSCIHLTLLHNCTKFNQAALLSSRYQLIELAIATVVLFQANNPVKQTLASVQSTCFSNSIKIISKMRDNVDDFPRGWNHMPIWRSRPLQALIQSFQTHAPFHSKSWHQFKALNAQPLSFDKGKNPAKTWSGSVQST